MKHIYLLLTVMLICTLGYSQSFTKRQDSTVYAFKYYLIRTTRYPAVAAENDVRGDVIVAFNLDKDEKMNGLKIIKGLSKECDSAALLAIRKYQGILHLPSATYTIGLNYSILEEGKKNEPISPINLNMFKNFLFEAAITKIILPRKQSVTN